MEWVNLWSPMRVKGKRSKAEGDQPRGIFLASLPCPGRVNPKAGQALSTQLPPLFSEEMGFPGACTGSAVTRGSTWMAEEVTQALGEKVSLGALPLACSPTMGGQGWGWAGARAPSPRPR